MDFRKVECSQADLDASAEKWSARLDGATIEFDEKHCAMDKAGERLLGVVYWTGRLKKTDGTIIPFDHLYSRQLDTLCANHGISVQQAYQKNSTSSTSKNKGVAYRSHEERVKVAEERLDKIINEAKDDIMRAVFSAIDRDKAIAAIVSLLEDWDAHATAVARQPKNTSTKLAIDAALAYEKTRTVEALMKNMNIDETEARRILGY